MIRIQVRTDMEAEVILAFIIPDPPDDTKVPILLSSFDVHVATAFPTVLDAWKDFLKEALKRLLEDMGAEVIATRELPPNHSGEIH